MEWYEFQDPSLIQGSNQWLEMKKDRIGSQSIASIMQVKGAFMTRRQLWEYMTDRAYKQDISHLAHIKKAHDIERYVRDSLGDRLGFKYTTPVIQHEKHPMMVASFDGLAHDHSLEVKFLKQKAHENVRLGIIDEKYRMQCQWGMMIAKVDTCLFASSRGEDIAEFWIDADPGLQRHMLAKALQFWRWVRRDIPPPELTLDI